MARPGVCCAKGSTIQPLDQGCSITRLPADSGCIHKRTLVTLAHPPVGTFIKDVFIHENCVSNQHIAIVNRVLGVTPGFQSHMAKPLKSSTSLIARHLPRTPEQPIGKFALKYSGAKRARYLRAANDWLENGITRQNAGVTMFVKADRLDPKEKIRPDPRPVQFRDPLYCVDIARFLKPIEKHLYRLTIPSISPYRLIGKGLNQYERASLLIKKCNRFGKFVVLSLDASRYDKHINRTLLRAEHRVYRKCNSDPHFRQLLKWQEVNKGRTASGIKYTTSGKRMSGDMNTALGNCIIMLAMIIAVFDGSNIKYDILDDGDDCMVICHVDDELRARQCIVRMNDFGMVIKTENVAYTIEDVEWCQSKPVLTARGWKFCRNPLKVISYALSGTKWKHLNAKGRKTYLRGLAECECILNKGVPVLTAYSEALLRNAGCGKTTFDTTSGEYFRYVRELRAVKSVEEFVPITMEARLSFEAAFNIPVHVQEIMETNFRQWSFTLDGLVIDEPVIDNQYWIDQKCIFPPTGEFYF